MSYVYLGVASVISVSTRDLGVLMLPCVVGAGFMSLRVGGSVLTLGLLAQVIGPIHIVSIRSMNLKLSPPLGSGSSPGPWAHLCSGCWRDLGLLVPSPSPPV